MDNHCTRHIEGGGAATHLGMLGGRVEHGQQQGKVLYRVEEESVKCQNLKAGTTAMHDALRLLVVGVVVAAALVVVVMVVAMVVVVMVMVWVWVLRASRAHSRISFRGRAMWRRQRCSA